MMEDQTPEVNEDLGTGGKIKNWLQDNIRIVISVLIVVAIAGGIYSYSKRGEAPVAEEDVVMEEVSESEGEELASEEESAVTIINEEEAGEEAEEEVEAEEIIPAQPKVEEQKQEEVKIDEVTEDKNQAISEETADSFVETAVAGDSVTTLARKALRDYLEKNQDSSLTAEHKIYIEDYLRKNVSHAGSLLVGDEISFSKVLIKDSIEKAKTLNENQLNNLKQYSARVSNL